MKITPLSLSWLYVYHPALFFLLAEGFWLSNCRRVVEVCVLYLCIYVFRRISSIIQPFQGEMSFCQICYSYPALKIHLSYPTVEI